HLAHPGAAGGGPMTLRTVLTAVLALLAPAPSFAHSNDREPRAPVNYFTLLPPSPGQRMLDPAYGTAVWRVSDARHQPSAADNGPLAFIVNEYSTVSS